MRTPTWADVRDFLRHDDWVPDRSRSTDHDHFEKTLPNGGILITRVSRSGSKTMSPGRFKAILADQLQVDEGTFREVIRTKVRATRPVPEPEPAPASLPLWLVEQLEVEGIDQSDIEGLDEESARALLTEARSKPRD